MSIYILKSLSGAEEYIQIIGDVSKIRMNVLKSEIHLLNDDIVQFEISEQGGLVIPDILYYEGIYLLSNRVKELLDRNNADYLHWIKAKIRSKKLGFQEKFWIIIPPKIDCVDIDRSEIDVSKWDYSDGLIPMFEYTSLRIVPKLVGRYGIFKILGIRDNNIYITDRLFEQFKSQDYDGIEFIKLQ